MVKVLHLTIEQIRAAIANMRSSAHQMNIPQQNEQEDRNGKPNQNNYIRPLCMFTCDENTS